VKGGKGGKGGESWIRRKKMKKGALASGVDEGGGLC
jgi:hypothetical protein